MGGSGGGIGAGWKKPEEIAREVREVEQKVQNEGFQTELADYLTELLSRLNDRDVKLVHDRIEQILNALQGEVADKIEQIFGGSVAKRTYIDGVSDIDCLLIMDKQDLSKGPKAMLHSLEAALQKGLSSNPKIVDVSAGRMAITVKYADGQEIQLLPAAKNGDQLKIPSSRGENRWSAVDPKSFQQALSKYNDACNGKLVPTIKLAKAIISQLPEAQQLSGYHVESLAIDAFKNYNGTKTTTAMLPHFFEHAKERVLRPMTDRTGQSVHVDDYMGDKNSPSRNNASHLLGRLSKRISNATAVSSLPQWKALFGNDE